MQLCQMPGVGATLWPGGTYAPIYYVADNNVPGGYRLVVQPPATASVSAEDVQDAVSGMMSSVGLTYDDAANQFKTTGGAGTFLIANGVGGAFWMPMDKGWVDSTVSSGIQNTPIVAPPVLAEFDVACSSASARTRLFLLTVSHRARIQNFAAGEAWMVRTVFTVPGSFSASAYSYDMQTSFGQQGLSPQMVTEWAMESVGFGFVVPANSSGNIHVKTTLECPVGFVGGTRVYNFEGSVSVRGGYVD